MKKDHIDIKPIAIAFTIGVIISGTVASIVLKPAKLSQTTQWCIANTKLCDFAKAKHEKGLKALEEVLTEK